MESSVTTKSGGLARLIEKFIPRWAARNDSEHEQAVIRLLVGGTAALYLASHHLRDGAVFTLTNPTLFIISLFFSLTAVIFFWLYVSPPSSVPRRLLGAVTDLGLTTAAIYLNGNLATPMFCIYLWVTFGNGFRFGRRYLFFSMLLSAGGFSLVLLFSPNWTLNNHVSLSLLIGLIVLPLYVSALLGRLTHALEESETANRTKSSFLSTMSHEIRTPLSGIVGVISLLKQSELDREQKRYLKIIENSARRLSQLLSDGLDYSKIKAGELIIENQPYLLRETIEEAAAGYREKAEALDLDFICLIDSKLPGNVIGDRTRLLQIIDNLLSNSFKFTEHGTVVLKASLSSRNEYNATVRFSVSDTGIGIPENQRDTIFEPFQQLDGSMDRKREGSGLGLTITARLLNLMGSRLELTSQEGKGSIFHFDVTLPLAHPDKAASLSLDDGTGPHWVRKPHILIAEDNTTNQEVISSLIQALDCTTDIAVNGRQAVEKLVYHVYDLVFMDCQMPVMDGYEATRRIRASNSSRNREIPIIALTAHVTIADREMCRKAGMTDYQGKPCGLADLRLLLKKWLPELLAPNSRQTDATAAPQHPSPKTTSVKKVDSHLSENRKHIHELRNCYTKILGCAELIILGTLSPEKVSHHLTVIRDEVKKAEDITSRIS